MNSNQTKFEIVLLHHGTLTNDPCAICSARCDPSGLDFALAGTVALVCDNCARRHAPELCELVRDRGAIIDTLNNFPARRDRSLSHVIGVCLLCLQPGTLIWIRGQGFYYCENDRVYWDQSCDRNAFQRGNEYDTDESDKNEARLFGYIYTEPQVRKFFNAIREAQATKDTGPIGSDMILVEHVRHSSQCKLIYMNKDGVCDCGPAGRWFEQVSAREYEASLPPASAANVDNLDDSEIPF